MELRVFSTLDLCMLSHSLAFVSISDQLSGTPTVSAKMLHVLSTMLLFNRKAQLCSSQLYRRLKPWSPNIPLWMSVSDKAQMTKWIWQVTRKVTIPQSISALSLVRGGVIKYLGANIISHQYKVQNILNLYYPYKDELPARQSSYLSPSSPASLSVKLQPASTDCLIRGVRRL